MTKKKKIYKCTPTRLFTHICESSSLFFLFRLDYYYTASSKSFQKITMEWTQTHHQTQTPIHKQTKRERLKRETETKMRLSLLKCIRCVTF